MNLREYQVSVQRTCVTTDQHDTLKLALVGLQDELGEIAGPLKKYLWHGHPLDSVHLQDEVGDVLWYLATLCTALGLSLGDALQGNIEKLQRRYPQGFSAERSLNRSREGEGSSTPETAAPTLLPRLWQATNDALAVSWDTPVSREEMTSIGLQLGRLVRVLARRGISPIDETSVPASHAQKEE